MLASIFAVAILNAFILLMHERGTSSDKTNYIKIQ